LINKSVFLSTTNSELLLP